MLSKSQRPSHFRHFKNVGLLVKVRSGGFKLNLALKGMVKEEE